jgi:hypothetical protein
MRFEGAERRAALTQMQQVATHLFLGQEVGRAPIMRGQCTNALQINGLGVWRQASSPHVFDHLRKAACGPIRPSRSSGMRELR